MTAVWTRINTLLLLLVLLALLAVIALLATNASGGPLDPAGPVASTDGVREPGTPISSLPFEIITPGHYYLTRNLVGVSGQPGISVLTTDVTIDLHGFKLEGGGGTLDAIVSPGTHNITIRNGTITGWGGSGIFIDFPAFSLGSRIHDLHVTNNGGYGIRVGDRAVIHDVTVRSNQLDGIATSRNAVIERCVVSDNTGDGIDTPFNSVISRCSVINNGGDGIRAGQTAVVRDNTVTNNGGDGIETASLATVDGNVVAGNGATVADGAGVRSTGVNARITNNLLQGNDLGIASSGALITGNFASNVNNYGQAGGLLGPILTGATIDDTGANPHANFE